MKSHGLFCVSAIQLIAFTIHREVAKVASKLKTNTPVEGRSCWTGAELWYYYIDNMGERPN